MSVRICKHARVDRLRATVDGLPYFLTKGKSVSVPEAVAEKLAEFTDPDDKTGRPICERCDHGG